MAEVIRMPKMSDTMEEGVIASWQVKVGDKVESGDILAEVETDKATMELESYNDGVLLHIGVQEKDAVPVNGVLAIIGEEGEDISDLLKEIENEGQGGGEEKKEEKAAEKETKSEAPASEDIDVSDINATVVAMPKMSDTMQEGTIAAWHKKVGDSVESGDILAEVETDKATMELEAYEDGTLLYIGVEEGDAVPVDAVIAVIGEEGADYEKLLKAHKAKQQEGEETVEPEDTSAAEGAPRATAEKRDTVAKPSDEGKPEVGTDADGRIKASPLAKKMAEEKGYDLSRIKGTGEGGRIVRRDIEEYTPQAEAPKQAAAAPGAVAPGVAPSKEAAGTAYTIPKVVGEERYEDRKVSQMRKTIAKRLAESKFTAPHFYLTMEIDMDKAIEARKSLNEISPVKISFNDLVIKAVAASLRQHPKVNVSWRGDTMRFNEHIHIGVAVAVEEGLLVPVVRFADNKSLAHISAEVKELGQKAKNKQLQPKDWEGSTFTISNLGMFGIEQFTAIVNPPDACILAVGGIKETPVVKNGQLVPGNIMKVTLSCDHRAVDGAVGSAFLQTFKNLLEDPVRILI